MTLAQESATTLLFGRYRTCSRCIYDERVAGIQFDEDGVCNYCRMVDDLTRMYGTGSAEGEAQFARIIDEIKRAGRRREYDCVIGVSGGTDSSYMVAKAVDWGLRPVAAHYDNTWNSAVATENIRKVLSKLNVPLYTHVVDNREVDDIIISFLKASVPELEGPTDLALTETLYRAAAKYRVGYILEGHSFRAEGVAPLGMNYFDGKYIESIHRKFGKRPMKTFPNMTFTAFLKWTALYRIRKIRPWWYLSYSKAEARQYLEDRFGWVYYGGHHLENRLTSFHHTYYNPVKFGIDMRNLSLAAQVRSNLMDREAAIEEYEKGPAPDPELMTYFLKRLGLTAQEYDRLMDQPPKTYRDYPTYKQRFERLRPLFWMMAKANLVPMSFYIKYTSKSEV